MDYSELEFSKNFPEQEDGYQRMWTPHRMVYVNEDHKEFRTKEECVFCDKLLMDDETALIVFRTDLSMVIMNLYPYNSGHIMVIPKRHIAAYDELTPEELVDFTNLTIKAVKAVKETLKPDGLNLGINQGRVAGAGIAAHLHQHIIPRWLGDANFFPLVAQTRIVGTLLSEQRDKLAQWFNDNVN
jgi:ATP adenylyltransferase